MTKMIESLEIFKKYIDENNKNVEQFPVNSSHYSMSFSFYETIITEKDILRLKELGWNVSCMVKLSDSMFSHMKDYSPLDERYNYCFHIDYREF